MSQKIKTNNYKNYRKDYELIVKNNLNISSFVLWKIFRYLYITIIYSKTSKKQKKKEIENTPLERYIQLDCEREETKALPAFAMTRFLVHMRLSKNITRAGLGGGQGVRAPDLQKMMAYYILNPMPE